MKRRSFLASATFAAASLLTHGNAEPTSRVEAATPEANPLKFRADGKFKILIISDTHYYPRPDKYGIALTEYLIDTEKPDVVIITGDVITGNASNTPEQIKQSIANVAQAMENKEVPWAITFGNHDREAIKKNTVTGEQQIAMYESYPYNRNAGWVRGLSGTGVKNLLVWSSDGAKPLFNLWLFDSGNGNALPKGTYIETDQVAWYRETSIALEKQYGAAIPGAMFFHIPLQEYKEMIQHRKLVGERKEPEMVQEVNGGLFSAAMERGDISGIFCGHDHDNNYIGKWRGIMLGYVGITGYYAYPHVAPEDPVNGRARGGRLIELSADDPTQLKTWLRFRDGSVSWEVGSKDYMEDHVDEPNPPKYWAP